MGNVLKMAAARTAKSLLKNNNILVVNCGSSSIKFQVIDPITKCLSVNGIAERLNTPKAVIKLKEWNQPKTTIDIRKTNDHKSVFDKIFQDIFHENGKFNIKAIGHRVVHGGDYFKTSAIITGDVKEKIKMLFPLAPIHNPNNLMGIKFLQEKFPDLTQVAVFDTSFHVSSMPAKAYRYAVPEDWYTSHKVRRYGFHGTSHKYVANEASKILDKPLENLDLITAHLGHGCSIAAIKNGKSLDTSMGFSPLEGLMMGSRSGDIDPNVINYMLKQCNYEKDIFNTLNTQSGFGAVSGVADSRDLEDLYFSGNGNARLAVEMFCYKIAKTMASYFVPLEGIPDAIVFTAGIGERSPLKRKLVTNALKSFGFDLDQDKNEKNELIISNQQSSRKVLVIPTNEELVIANETLELIM